MMKYYQLCEDKQLPKLSVIISAKLLKKIYAIDEYNQDNIEALFEWYDYLEFIKDYVSNSTIAWDNMDRYPMFNKNCKFINDIEDCKVGYSIIIDKYSGKPCVFIFMMNLKPQEYGLKIPPILSNNESVCRITQSDICHIVESVVREYLNRQTLNETYMSDAKYEIIDGDRIEMRHESLSQKGWFNDIRMYHSPNKTYCLLKRCDNGKYFYALIVPAPELGKDETKFEIVPYKSVPFSIRQDSLSLLQKGGTQRNEIFVH